MMKMKRISLLVFVLLLAESGLAQAQLWKAARSGIGQQRRQQLRRPNAMAPRGAPIEDLVEGFYISQFSEVVGVGDDQLAKVLPILRQGLRERREIAARRAQTLNQLRLVTERGDAEDEIRKLVREIDKTDADALTRQQKLVNEIDPHLNARQQAKFRMFQVMVEQRIRQMLDRARDPGNRQP